MPRQPMMGSRIGVMSAASPIFCRPGLGDQRHADAELTAQPEAGDGAINEQIPIALRQGAETGEYREQKDGPGQDTHAAVIVAQRAEQDAAGNGADQRPGNQRTGLGRSEMQLGGNRPQHEAQNEQIEPIHRIADGGRGNGFARKGADTIGRFGDVGVCNCHEGAL
jgi:hypothetical protein